MNVESVNVESVNVESVNVESVNVESVNVESVNVESVNVESVNVESVNVESVSVEGRKRHIVPPEALIVAGPNGAGKSTFAQEYLAEHDLPFLSADAVAEQLRPDDPTAARIRAGRVFLERLAETIRSGRSFVVETTLAGRGFLQTMRQLQAEGYDITIVFLFVDSPQTSIRRVEERVRKGGHHVPNEAVRRRYYRSMSNFWNEYRRLAGAGTSTTMAPKVRGASPAEQASATP